MVEFVLGLALLGACLYALYKFLKLVERSLLKLFDRIRDISPEERELLKEKSRARGELIKARLFLIGFPLTLLLLFGIIVWAVIADEPKTTAHDQNKILACEEAIKKQVNFPSTVRLHWFLDGSWVDHDNGRQTLFTSFTASNAFGVEQRYTVRCLYERGGHLIEAQIGA